MAYLATLEGEDDKIGITLDDLFNVNDYLGVRIFGVEPWNRIKAFACQLTTNAARYPVLFCISNVNRDFQKPSPLACQLFGFNDTMGVCALGSTTWNTLKSRLDDELLGFSITGAISSAVNKVTNVASKPVEIANKVFKTAVDVPNKVIDTVVNKTPIKYTPFATLVNKATEAQKKLLNTAKNVTQTTVDTVSAGTNALVDKTPLKYVGTAQVIAAAEKTKEKAGVTSPGTTGQLPTAEETAELKYKAAKAAAEAASAASKKQMSELTKAAIKKKEEEKTAEAQKVAEVAKQEQAAAEKALDVMENRVSSKYAPIFIAGAFGLLAIMALKK